MDHNRRPSSNPGYDLAIKDFDWAIRLDPSSPAPYVERGRALWMQGRDDRAIQSYDQALQANPRYFSAYYARASAHVERKEFDLAIADATRWIQLAPGSARAYVERGFAYSQAGQSSQAILDDNRAITIAPQYGAAWNNRCWDRAIAGKLTEAREDCEHVLDLYPHYAGALDSLGFVYLKMKNPTMAIANYKAALAEEPNEPTSLYGLGMAELQKGDSDAAHTDMEAGKALQPDIANDFAKWGVPLASPRAHAEP
jgi:tetratricopeptide (TPR) repeat protein